MEKKKPFYGWVIVAACFILTMFPMVFVSNTFSYYQYPICNDLGISYVEFNVASLCSSIACMGFSFLLAGKMARGNMRLWMLVGGIITAGAILLQSFITAIWQLYITFFVANFALSTLTYIPINTLISSWFVHKKALATSVAFMGAGIGGMIFTPVVSNIISSYGWRTSFRVVAAVVLVTAFIVTAIVRKSPADMGQSPLTKEDGQTQSSAGNKSADSSYGIMKKDAVKTGAFWLFMVAAVCCGMLSAGIMTQVPTYLMETVGDYAVAMSIYNAVGILSKPVLGVMYDKLGLAKGVWVNALLGCCAMVLLLLVPSVATTALAAAVFLSFGTGVGTLAPPLIAGRLFGTKDYGAIYGLVNFGFMGGCMIGPMLSSTIRTISGSYISAWIVYVVIFVVMAVFAMVARKAGDSLREKASRTPTV